MPNAIQLKAILWPILTTLAIACVFGRKPQVCILVKYQSPLVAVGGGIFGFINVFGFSAGFGCSNVFRQAAGATELGRYVGGIIIDKFSILSSSDPVMSSSDPPIKSEDMLDRMIQNSIHNPMI